MVIKLLYKNTLIKIKTSFGRYISLLIIVMVGVGFLSGLRASSPDIISGVDQFYKQHNLMDFRIVSTMGLTDDDVNALKSLKGVGTVVPSYSLDVLNRGNAIKVQALESSVNTVNLITGRMPKTDTECLADSRKYKIGNKITITSDVSDKLKNKEFTVVGTVKSPLYMSTDYGNTTIGNGKLYSFIFVNKDNFTMDVYTQIYLVGKDTKEAAAYSKEYTDMIYLLNNELVKIKAERETARDQVIYNKASNTIIDNQAKLNDQKATGEKQLADTKAQLDASMQKLNDAQTQLDQNKADLQKKVDAQNAQFQSEKDQIANGWSQINATLSSNGIPKDQLDDKINQLNTAIQSLKTQQSQLSSNTPEYAQLGTQISQYTTQYQGLVKLQTSIATLATQENQLNQGIQAFNTQISKAQAQINAGQSELNTNKQKLQNGYTQYNQNLAEFNSKIADAQTKIDNAKADLSTIEKAKWYVYDRDDAVVGYKDLNSGASTIDSVAAVFPLFFILIVMLMTSNTMARMIVEERGELGTLTSLGFSNGSIISTYLLYVLSATVLGAVGGFLIGASVIPTIIFTTFNKFILPPLVIKYDIISLLLILTVAIALMTAVTIFFCNSELKQKPAALMRPVPPKHGQKIFLERIIFIWRNLSFTWKVTMRNIFRYKQRVFMTIVGVAGCTALLIAGFGIRDSIDGVAERQYNQIFKYNAILALKNATPSISGDLEALLTKEKVENPLLVKQTTFKAVSGNQSLDTYLLVPENENLFKKYYNLTSLLTGTNIKINDSGVVITQKLAQILKIGKGGTIKIKDANSNSYSLPVSDVAENYMQNYIYVSKNLYNKVFGEDASYNMLISDYGENQSTLANHLLKDGSIVNVKNDILQQAADGNKSLNNVVILIVVVAIMLAIIVLYNLTSIDISERKREIATLKVLGFNDKETNQYIYREVFLLTLISIGIGLLLGIPMHRFVIGIIEGDASVYFKNIHGISFVCGFLIVLVISIIMQMVTYFKMQKIDMIESLKSVE